MGLSKASEYLAMVKDEIIYTTDKDKAEIFNETYLESANVTEDQYDTPLVDSLPNYEPLSEITVT